MCVAPDRARPLSVAGARRRPCHHLSEPLLIAGRRYDSCMENTARAAVTSQMAWEMSPPPSRPPAGRALTARSREGREG